MQPSGQLPPSEIKPLPQSLILFSAIVTAVMNLAFTLNATSDEMIWDMTGTPATAIAWLAIFWTMIVFGVWAFLLLSSFLQGRTTTVRSLAVIAAIGISPSFVLALFIAK